MANNYFINKKIKNFNLFIIIKSISIYKLLKDEKKNNNNNNNNNKNKNKKIIIVFFS